MGKLRGAIDLISFGGIFLGMAYWLTGNFFHECVGIFACSLLFFHAFLNARQFNIGRTGRLSAKKLFSFILNCSLAGALLSVFVSGILLSQDLFAFVPAGNGLLARRWHTCAAAWLLILSATHAGMHWQFFAGIFKLRKFIKDKKFRILLWSLALAGTIHGGNTFFRRDFYNKLNSSASFDALALSDSWGTFIADYAGLVSLFFVLGVLFKELMGRREIPKKTK